MYKQAVSTVVTLGMLLAAPAYSAEYRDPPFDDMPVTVVRGMHSCDEGYVMRGVDFDRNVFLCYSPIRGANQDDAKRRTVDALSSREVAGLPMHVCPSGMVMKGFHNDKNLLLCETAALGSEVADAGMMVGGIRVCPSGNAMIGIH